MTVMMTMVTVIMTIMTVVMTMMTMMTVMMTVMMVMMTMMTVLMIVSLPRMSSPAAREIGLRQRLIWWLIGLLLENIRVEFQRPTVTCSLVMTCRLHQRVTWLTAGVGWKFIYFWKLHTIPFLRAKFQLILITLNFDDFGGSPSKISGRGRWVWSMTFPKWRRWIAKTLILTENNRFAKNNSFYCLENNGIKKVSQDPYSAPPNI